MDIFQNEAYKATGKIYLRLSIVLSIDFHKQTKDDFSYFLEVHFLEMTNIFGHLCDCLRSLGDYMV